MQIERLAKDPEYARKQFERGGAYFQLMTEGVFTSAQVMEFAPAIAADVIYIYERSPALLGLVDVVHEITQRAPATEAAFVALRLGMMLGIGHERARRIRCTRSK